MVAAPFSSVECSITPFGSKYKGFFQKSVAFRLHAWYNGFKSGKEAAKMSDLGELVKALRTGKEYSIRKLAELSDVSHTEIKRIEDGKRVQPSPKVLRAIANALNTPYADLMAAAHYIEEHPEESTAAAGIKDTEDLSEDEIAKVNEYIAFLKTQRK